MDNTIKQTLDHLQVGRRGSFLFLGVEFIIFHGKLLSLLRNIHDLRVWNKSIHIPLPLLD
jgi:hypothetical protein